MRSFGHLWRTDRGLTALLLILFVTLLVAPPLISSRVLSPVFFDVLFSLILVAGAATVSGRKWPALLSAGLALVTLGMRWVRVGTHSPSLSVLDAGLTAFTFLMLAALVLFQVLRKGPITVYRVLGSVAAYLLLGLAWAGAYELVFRLSPGAFRPPEEAQDPMSLLYYSFYSFYSFVTLTTVGYGDITPVLPAARSLAMAEGLVGQLFPAVLIARLVSMEIASRGGADRLEGGGRG